MVVQKIAPEMMKNVVIGVSPPFGLREREVVDNGLEVFQYAA